MFFDIFTELCKNKGVSCKKAAEEMGLSNSITTKWKKTSAIPDGATLVKMAKYFKVSVDYLLGLPNRLQDRNQMIVTENEMLLLKVIRTIKNEVYEDYTDLLCEFNSWEEDVKMEFEKARASRWQMNLTILALDKRVKQLESEIRELKGGERNCVDMEN